MSEYKISARAYAKIIFHAAKYPHCAVNGVLLAIKDAVKNKPLTVVDAIPLFHQCLHVSPMSEIALIQIEAMAEQYGLQIVGYYAGSDNLYEASVDKAPAVKIADKIVENFPNACFAVIDNKFITLAMEKAAIKLFRYSENRWNPASFTLDQSETTLDVVSSLLKRGAMKDIVDFDNHLDNPENDWTNQFLNRDLTKILAMY